VQRVDPVLIVLDLVLPRMDEYERRLPGDARTERATRWSEAVRALAERFDPMKRVIEIAKELEPSDEVLAELVEAERERGGDAAVR
jgi:hypothetical protein